MTDRKFTPHLREGLGARPEEFARSTCFEGGYLTSVNAGWRSLPRALHRHGGRARRRGSGGGDLGRLDRASFATTGAGPHVLFPKARTA